MNDSDPLSPLLKSWQHRPPEAPAFNAAVWSRIESAPPVTELFDYRPAAIIARGLGIPAQHFRWALPLAACIVIVVSAAIGSSAAVAYDSLTRDHRMARAYARSIDPLQMMTSSR